MCRPCRSKRGATSVLAKRTKQQTHTHTHTVIQCKILITMRFLFVYCFELICGLLFIVYYLSSSSSAAIASESASLFSFSSSSFSFSFLGTGPHRCPPSRRRCEPPTLALPPLRRPPTTRHLPVCDFPRPGVLARARTVRRWRARRWRSRSPRPRRQDSPRPSCCTTTRSSGWWSGRRRRCCGWDALSLPTSAQRLSASCRVRL
mmetsp:Transcript_37222/g.92230  ORF Transcript_37222/g.92230 Transcript_37222/m.92230 type:complete len:204 (+) Transcript_37222:1443-2054(+)